VAAHQLPLHRAQRVTGPGRHRRRESVHVQCPVDCGLTVKYELVRRSNCGERIDGDGLRICGLGYLRLAGAITEACLRICPEEAI
jgi:hypothetical protein